MTTTKSQVRINAEKDPNYCPYCLRCSTMARMTKVAPMYWRCRCGAEHDERSETEKFHTGPECVRCGRREVWHPDGSCHFFAPKESSEADVDKLREALMNAKGFLDTPVMRLRYEGDWFYQELIESLRAVTPDQQ